MGDYSDLVVVSLVIYSVVVSWLAVSYRGELARRRISRPVVIECANRSEYES